METLITSRDVLRAFGDRCADQLTALSGTWTFVLAHLVWWATWFGFGLDQNSLTLVVSLEAILLSCLVLMSQSRQGSADRAAQRLMEEHVDLTLAIVRHIEEINGAPLPRA